MVRSVLSGVFALLLAGLLPGSLPGLLAAPALAAGAPPAGAAQARFEQSIEAAKSAMMSDPQQALGLVDRALQRGEALPEPDRAVARATALWLRIEANIGLNRPVEAQQHLEAAMAIVTRAAPGSKLHGDLMRSQGAIAAMSGKAPDALRFYLAAHRIYKQLGDRRAQAIALQDIGTIYGEAGDYERELAYAGEAQEIYDDDPAFALTINNNRGETYRILGRRAEAEKAFLAALVNARAIRSPLLETRILTNLALVQIELGKLGEAARNAAQAERLGLGADARDWLPFVYGAQAAIAAKRRDDRSALALVERVFAGTDLTQTDLTYKEFHQLAADLYARGGLPAKALPHLQAFQRLDSEARDLISSASSQLLGAQFNSANQKARIAELKRGQLERDVAIAQQKSMIAQGLLAAALALIIVAGAALLSIRKSRNEVRDANGVLTQVNTKLEHALKAKTAFLAMTSHEIRTPLNGIMGMTQVLLADRALDAQTRERVSLVLGAGRTMQSLVDDLLDVAKMENGGITVSEAPADLRAILREGVQLWQAEASAKGIAIAFIEEAPLPLVTTDAGRFRQVIFNLLANAIKFTPTGSVTVRARRPDAQTLEICVEDTGIGIPEDQLDTVFEAFHQVDNGMTRDFGGAGLGLAICRNIMTALGGTISVSSKPGAGSVFRLTLPVAAGQAKEPVSEEAQGAPDRGGEGQTSSSLPSSSLPSSGLTLIVDRSELRLAKLKAVLQPHVSSLAGCMALADAQQFMQAGQVRLVVLDTATLDAEADKAAAAARFMALAEQQNVCVIVLLAADDEVSAAAFAAANPAAVLKKPLKAAYLIEAIRSASLGTATGGEGFPSQVA